MSIRLRPIKSFKRHNLFNGQANTIDQLLYLLNKRTITHITDTRPWLQLARYRTHWKGAIKIDRRKQCRPKAQSRYRSQFITMRPTCYDIIEVKYGSADPRFAPEMLLNRILTKEPLSPTPRIEAFIRGKRMDSLRGTRSISTVFFSTVKESRRYGSRSTVKYRAHTPLCRRRSGSVLPTLPSGALDGQQSGRPALCQSQLIAWPAGAFCTLASAHLSQSAG